MVIQPHHIRFGGLAGRWIQQNALGWDIGGGVNVFFGHTFGIRGDVRRVRTLQDITLGGVFSNAPLDFFRASAGVTLRF